MPDASNKKKSVKVTDINPQVKDVEIGIRHLRKVKIYPLSVADQLDLTDLITEGVGAFFALDAEQGAEGGPPVEFILFAFELIKSNIGELITKITGEEDSDAILHEMSNAQLAEIVEIVYTENYAGPLGKIVGVFRSEETEVLSILEKLQSQSAASTETTDSKTSSEEVTGKEVSP